MSHYKIGEPRPALPIMVGPVPYIITLMRNATIPHCQHPSLLTRWREARSPRSGVPCTFDEDREQTESWSSLELQSCMQAGPRYPTAHTPSWITEQMSQKWGERETPLKSICTSVLLRFTAPWAKMVYSGVNVIVSLTASKLHCSPLVKAEKIVRLDIRKAGTGAV